MFLKSIRTSIKLFLLSIKIKRLSLKNAIKPNEKDNLKTMGVLVNADKTDVPSLLKELEKQFNIPKEQISILSFSREPHKMSSPSFVLGAQLSWFSGDVSAEVLHFKEASYKYFINFYGTQHPILELINIETKALFKIGFIPEMERQLDFILDTNYRAPESISVLASYIHKISL